MKYFIYYTINGTEKTKPFELDADDSKIAEDLFLQLFPGTTINSITTTPPNDDPPNDDPPAVEKPAELAKKVLLKPGRCEYCNKRLVVMATPTGSVLPVEVDEGEVPFFTSDVFNSTRHKSHLLNCREMQLNWKEKQKKFIASANPLSAFQKYAPTNLKELCR